MDNIYPTKNYIIHKFGKIYPTINNIVHNMGKIYPTINNIVHNMGKFYPQNLKYLLRKKNVTTTYDNY